MRHRTSATSACASVVIGIIPATAASASSDTLDDNHGATIRFGYSSTTSSREALEREPLGQPRATSFLGGFCYQSAHYSSWSR